MPFPLYSKMNRYSLPPREHCLKSGVLGDLLDDVASVINITTGRLGAMTLATMIDLSLPSRYDDWARDNSYMTEFANRLTDRLLFEERVETDYFWLRKEPANALHYYTILLLTNAARVRRSEVIVEHVREVWREVLGIVDASEYARVWEGEELPEEVLTNSGNAYFYLQHNEVSLWGSNMVHRYCQKWSLDTVFEYGISRRLN